MGLKRKRSVDASPLSFSSFCRRSSPDNQSFAPHPAALEAVESFGVHMEVDPTPHSRVWDFTSAGRVKTGDWGNRTCKRFRDNRPDERAIHENTLGKLFAAQRNRPDATPIMSDILSATQQLHNTSKPQKSTLHFFWKQLPLPPPVGSTIEASSTMHNDMTLRRCCEDCDSPLLNSIDSMDVDMDTATAVDAEPFACCDCGKNVCATCAVVSLRRHCLPCATSGRNSRRWW